MFIKNKMKTEVETSGKRLTRVMGIRVKKTGKNMLKYD